jgi:hypothetical protein
MVMIKSRDFLIRPRKINTKILENGLISSNLFMGIRGSKKSVFRDTNDNINIKFDGGRDVGYVSFPKCI